MAPLPPEFYQLLAILFFIVIIFAYTLISADSMTSILAFSLYLLLLLPVLNLLNKLKILLYDNPILRLVYNLSFIVLVFVGFALFIQTMYLFFMS